MKSDIEQLFENAGVEYRNIINEAEDFDEVYCIKEKAELSGMDFYKYSYNNDESKIKNIPCKWFDFLNIISKKYIYNNRILYKKGDNIIDITPCGNVYITKRNDSKRRMLFNGDSFKEIYNKLKEKKLLPFDFIKEIKSVGEKINSLFENTGLENNESFSLPKTVPSKFFKITDNLNDVERWRVKILQNNSSENKRRGSFDSVGYIMVSLADNTIIPIARSDEHHRGYEIMETIYQDEYNINSSKYYPIFCLGNNYPYNQDEALKMKEALAKLKSYGYDLDKLNVSMYYITKGEDERYVTGNEFLDEIESNEEQRKNIPVTPIGKNLVKALEMFSDAFEYKNVRGELSLTKISNAWRQLYNIGKDIMLNKEDVLISWFDDETVSDLLQKYKDGYITEENLMNLVFGFGGIRQKIHNLLRRYHFSQVLVDELGNVDEVVNMIGAI